MREMRGDGRADDQALDLRRGTTRRPRGLQSPTGLADGLEVGVLYHRLAAQRVGGWIRPGERDAHVGPPYRSAVEANLAMPRLCGSGRRRCFAGRTYELFMTFLRRRAARPPGAAATCTSTARQMSESAADHVVVLVPTRDVVVLLGSLAAIAGRDGVAPRAAGRQRRRPSRWRCCWSCSAPRRRRGCGSPSSRRSWRCSRSTSSSCRRSARSRSPIRRTGSPSSPFSSSPSSPATCRRRRRIARARRSRAATR